MTENNPSEKIFSDENVLQITGQIVLGQTILVAYSIGLFNIFLANPFPLSVQEISELMNLKDRPVQAMVSCACSLEFLAYSDRKYQLTPLGRTFFDKRQPTFYGGALDLLIQHNEIMSFSSIKKAILSNSSQADNGKGIFDGENSLGSSEEFVKELHQKAYAPANYWVNLIDLSRFQKFIDIAGGSGMHTIAACKKNQRLKGIVCDREPVLKHTSTYIKKNNLQDRIKTQEIDLWDSAIIEGDVFFVADIFHDWDKEKCTFIAKKCYKSMPIGGKILIHEMLFEEGKTGPALTASYNMKMLLWTEGQQYSFKEIREILEKAGFKNIQKKKALGNWSLVIGEKLNDIISR